MKKKVTLETHLHKIADIDEDIRMLESVYVMQKKKLVRFMSSVYTTFPTYSGHDVEHKENEVSYEHICDAYREFVYDFLSVWGADKNIFWGAKG